MIVQPIKDDELDMIKQQEKYENTYKACVNIQNALQESRAIEGSDFNATIVVKSNDGKEYDLKELGLQDYDLVWLQIWFKTADVIQYCKGEGHMNP